MSSLSQFAPFAAGGLKSFQTGFLAQATIASGGGSGEDSFSRDVTVSSVNTSKTITAFQGSATFNAGAYMYGNPSATTYIMTTRMTSATNLRIAQPASGPSQTQIGGRWQVAEAA
jgi:hypothetical protein